MAKKEQTVTIKPAKGRPMLQWVGKRPLSRLTAFPAQTVETFGEDPENGGRLYHGDNKEVLAHLLANGYRGEVDLIYIDPPFDSGADYVRRVVLRGPKTGVKLDAEPHSLGEQLQYTDIWSHDNYLQFMYERLMLLDQLLSPHGALYLHCDYRKSHVLRVLLDEVLGPDAFRSEIIWQSSDAQSSARRYGPIHNTIFYYARGEDRTWNDVRTPLSKSTADAWYTHEETLDRDITNKLGTPLKKGTVRRYNLADLTARKRGGDTQYEWKGVRPPPGRYWAYSKDNMAEFDDKGLIEYSRSGRPYLKRYLDEVEGTAPQDMWTDISMIRGISGEDVSGYPTEKPEALLKRAVEISSNPGDLVLDCFIGSGTTAAVAQKLGRRWIGCDINKGAIQTSSKRLQTIITEQMAERAKRKNTPELIKDENAPPEPARYGFAVHRVNDYDLQIQHNEAVALACEHIGVTRTRSDAFFDGTLGKRLVKIVPFNHPLSPLDMEELKKELEARPEEQRDIMVVALGKELAVEKWLDDWNRLRKRGDVPNKIEVVELRTDPKYGKFFAHKPATAKVEIKRLKTKLKIEIKDFISPTIIERLEDQSGVLKPKIDDWRAMVDCVMVDPAYDGTVFNVALSDIPEKKTDLVQGVYELEIPGGTGSVPSAGRHGGRPSKAKKITVAVKIIDMLGEEVLVARDV